MFEFCFGVLFRGIGLGVLSSFTIILLRKRGLATLLSRGCQCIAFFHAVPWVGLWYVIVAFPVHDHLLFI